VSDEQPRRLVGKTLLAAWRLLCYKLTTHRFLSITLKRWIWALVILPPLVAWIGRLSWTWAISLSVLGAASLVGAELARHKQYILFSATPQDTEPMRLQTSDAMQAPQTTRQAQANAQAPSDAPKAPDALDVDEPLLCWTSGLLGVEGKTRALAGERASVSFVRTREHIVMAQVRRTRFLLLAPVSKIDVGYWYAFFYPRQVQSIRLGTLYCGFSLRPGLELCYTDQETKQSVQLYLGFRDRDARQRLLDNLRRDVKREAFVSQETGSLP
jgi:hypothetical protein